MKKLMKKQRGAILVMTALLVILLLGMAALALDLGRLYVQKTEMQNAADTAARAGAMELDGQSGARTRAVAAINNLLQHNAHFASKPELLDQLTYIDDLPAESSIIFYNWIGSSYDAAVPPCTPNADNKCVTTEDHNARYVEVRLYPDLVADPNAYTVDLFFLPVLGILIDDVAQVATVRARAVAGRHFFACNYPPLMLCNPFELAPTNVSFIQAVNDGLILDGASVVLKVPPGGSLYPGNFGFLVPKDQSGANQQGAQNVGKYLANPSLQGCTPAVVDTQTGVISSVIDGWNTRFGYEGKPDSIYGINVAPPAPNVIEYPRDTVDVPHGQPGDGVWDRSAYWAKFHPGVVNQPSNFSSISRWELYNWEISVAGRLPCDPDSPVINDCNNLNYDNWTWDHPQNEWWAHPEDKKAYAYVVPTAGQLADYRISPIRAGQPKNNITTAPAKRRIMFVAIIDCDDNEISGSMSNVPVGTFAKFFVLQASYDAADPDGEQFVVEFMGLATEEDAEYHVEILLYE